MIDKQDFYHGSAVIRIIDHEQFRTVRKNHCGYIINEAAFTFIKYTTKGRSPWRFTFSLSEVTALKSINGFKQIVIALVCGGDGIVALSFEEFVSLIDDHNGWISAKRNFHKQYEVKGALDNLKYKISLKRWPEILFE